MISTCFEGSNTLIVLDDCAAPKDVKGRTWELVKHCFLAHHSGIGMWVLADLAALQHREAFPREYGGSRVVLHAVGEDHDGHH